MPKQDRPANPQFNPAYTGKSKKQLDNIQKSLTDQSKFVTGIQSNIPSDAYNKMKKIPFVGDAIAGSVKSLESSYNKPLRDIVKKNIHEEQKITNERDAQIAGKASRIERSLMGGNKKNEYGKTALGGTNGSYKSPLTKALKIK